MNLTTSVVMKICQLLLKKKIKSSSVHDEELINEAKEQVLGVAGFA